MTWILNPVRNPLAILSSGLKPSSHSSSGLKSASHLSWQKKKKSLLVICPVICVDQLHILNWNSQSHEPVQLFYPREAPHNHDVILLKLLKIFFYPAFYGCIHHFMYSLCSYVMVNWVSFFAPGVQICNYPFTTRGILMGHIHLTDQNFQVLYVLCKIISVNIIFFLNVLYTIYLFNIHLLLSKCNMTAGDWHTWYLEEAGW